MVRRRLQTSGEASGKYMRVSDDAQAGFFTSKPQLRWSGASTGYAQLRTTKPVAKLHICVGERELVLEAEAKEVDEWKKAVLAVIAEITAERGRGPGMGPLHTHGSGGGLSTAAL